MELQGLHSQVVHFQVGFFTVFVEKPCADGEQRILVAKLGMYAFPNAYTCIDTDAKIAATVVLGVFDDAGNQGFEVCILGIARFVDVINQFIDGFVFTNVG